MRNAFGIVFPLSILCLLTASCHGESVASVAVSTVEGGLLGSSCVEADPHPDGTDFGCGVSSGMHCANGVCVGNGADGDPCDAEFAVDPLSAEALSACGDGVTCATCLPIYPASSSAECSNATAAGSTAACVPVVDVCAYLDVHYWPCE